MMADANAPVERTFPDGFLCCTATVAYQIEGAVNEDSRGASILLYAGKPNWRVLGSIVVQ